MWSSDTPISMPQPPALPILVDLQGFGFSMDGLSHIISEADLEAIMTPVVAPIDPGVDDGR